MAWRSGRDENDITLEELGFTSKEELKTQLAKVKQLEEVNTGLNTTVQAQTTELTSVKNTLAELEGKLTQVMQRVPTTLNNNSGGNGNGTVEIPSVVDDENAAFAVRMAPLYESNMTNTAIIMEDRVLRTISASDPLFSKMESDVRALIAKTPLQMRANLTVPQGAQKSIAEQVIENAYYVVKGRKADQIRTDAIAQKGEFFIEPARSGSSLGGTTTPQELTINTLTDEHRRIIDRMGIKPETYVKLINDGGPQMSGALVNKTGF